MASVSLENVSKFYENGIDAVKNVNLEIRDREFMVLVGPSGCGKSTTLRMIAGLETPSSGIIRIGDTVINQVHPKDRDVAMVFQNYALYPHMTVFENMAFALKLRDYPAEEISRRVREAAGILNITDLLDRYPGRLSGGQCQRVAVGRAIVRKPKAFLFDEPLSNLDAQMRIQMRLELSRLHQQLECTMIYVTHDQTEAMTMGERICVMNDGKIQQVAPPMELYDHPANRFVAGFTGTPSMNFFEGELQPEADRLWFTEAGMKFVLPGEWRNTLAAFAGRKITFGLRPEDVGSEAAELIPGNPKVEAVIEVIEPMGAESLVYLNTGNSSFVAKIDPHRKLEVGDFVRFPLNLDRGHFFHPENGQTLI